MEELTTEQKAQRYDEALVWMQDLYPTMEGSMKEDAEHYFPELKESEDERTMKRIIALVNAHGQGMYKDEMLAWLEKQYMPQVRTGLEWVNTIDDACDKRYSEEYAHGEYCHEQSFKWGFQEGVDWLEKQGDNPTPINIDKMVMEYSQTKDGDFGLPVNCMIRAYRQGVIDVLNLLSGIEKQDSQILANSTKTCKDKHKFKVGDEIKTDKEEPLIITKIDEEGYWSEDLFICSFDEEHLWDLVEQNPTNKIEPKFKAGDRIIGIVSGIQYYISEVHNDYYFTEEGNCIMFNAQNNFKLYKQKPVDSYCQENCKGFKETGKGFTDEDYKAKKEAESINKVEPKFHEKDWIVNKDGRIFQIMRIDNDFNHITYACRFIEQDTKDWVSYSEDDISLWDISNAKNGDVLASNKSVFMFRQEYMGGKPEAHCGIMNGFFIVKPEGCWTNEKIYPATKEQRYALFAKIREAGYKWDAEKKELKKLRDE